MPDVDIEAALKERIATLQGEIDSLQVGLEAIQGSVSKSAPQTQGSAPAAPGRKRGRPAGSKNKPKARAARRSKSKAPGKRQQEFLLAVEKNPGIRAGEVADKIGVSKPHAYALAKVLKDKKAVTVKDNQYFIAGKSAPAKKTVAKKAAAKKPAAKKAAAKKPAAKKKS